MSPLTSTNYVRTTSITNQAFFVEEDLHQGNKLRLQFNQGSKNARILPRDIAKKIPFSSDKLPEIIATLSIDPKSEEAHILSENIKLCEKPTMEGVEKKCVTSLESMVDFVITSIGSDVQALYTKVDGVEYREMEYKIENVDKITKSDHQTGVCHKIEYPYALFFCHRTETVRSYIVDLAAENGKRVEAIAACHKETSKVMEEYMVDVLKVMPGSTRICHFPQAGDSIIWVANRLK